MWVRKPPPASCYLPFAQVDKKWKDSECDAPPRNHVYYDVAA